LSVRAPTPVFPGPQWGARRGTGRDSPGRCRNIIERKIHAHTCAS